MRAHAKAYTALQDLLVTAPAALREQLTGRYKGRLLHACQQLIASEIPTSPADAMILTIKSLAARCLHLDAEAAQLNRHIDTITATAAPQLRAVYGVGPDTAATLLSAIGDNPTGSAATPPSPNSAESARCKPPAEKPFVTD